MKLVLMDLQIKLQENVWNAEIHKRLTDARNAAQVEIA